MYHDAKVIFSEEETGQAQNVSHIRIQIMAIPNTDTIKGTPNGKVVGTVQKVGVAVGI